MKKLTLLLIVLFTINISTAQTSKAEVKQIIKEQSDGIVNNSQICQTAVMCWVVISTKLNFKTI